ncbi:GntR family galactonate operon transcriptional repressor [Silvimonas terrae]|uniref:GntR family galactonate operon transcriptional repressor n=1 Tax=Silvimonas terrae TaxID=300266 RepID=A0A840RAQ3_9NEIS|nr:FadR/GntR family transcriptional regulator [Silvimonas terrae]MBB5190489.1 GntR family galactonate operon transcriptional repressor [Silvimonas terrae]
MPGPDASKTDRIIGEIGRRIVQGEYLPDTPLPTEADLCGQFQTSRNLIREALRVLAAKRLVVTRRFRSVAVAAQSQWNYLDRDVLRWALTSGTTPGLIDAMTEVRNLVEPAAARWAAARATSADLAKMEAALNQMKAHNQQCDAFGKADLQFHDAVLGAVHNPVLQQLGSVLGALQQVVFSQTYMGDVENMPRTLREHQNLYEAIRHQHIADAEAAALTLIASATARLKDAP